MKVKSQKTNGTDAQTVERARAHILISHLTKLARLEPRQIIISLVKEHHVHNTTQSKNTEKRYILSLTLSSQS